MKKLFLSLFFLTCAISVSAQQGQRTFTVTTAPATDRGISNLGSGIAWHQVSWSTRGVVSACTVAIDSSADDITWSAGGIITGQSCTVSGGSSVVNVVANYIRINVTAFTGAGNVTVLWDGWNANPSGGGGSTNPGGSLNSVQYNAAGGVFGGNSSLLYTPSTNVFNVVNAGATTPTVALTNSTDIVTIQPTGNAVDSGAIINSAIHSIEFSVGSNTAHLYASGVFGATFGTPTGTAPLKLPTSIGTANFCLVTDGNNPQQTSWITRVPAGSNTQIQYNNSGVLGASSNFLYNNSTHMFSVNNSGTGSPDALVTIFGTGLGSFTGGNNPALLHISQDNSSFGAIFTNENAAGDMHVQVFADGESALWGGGTSGGAGSYREILFGNGGMSFNATVPPTSGIGYFFDSGISITGSTSGNATIGVAAVAGTPSTIILPTIDPSNGQVLTAGTPGGGKVTTSWTTVSGGGGSVSGQANGVIPLATGSTTIGAQSHMNDGNTTASTITGTETIAAPSFTASGTGAGYFQCTGGTAPTLISVNIQIACPSTVTTNYQFILPALSATGFLLGTNSSNVNTLSFVGSSGSGNICLVTSCAMTTPNLGTPSAVTLTNGSGLPLAGIGGETDGDIIFGSGGSWTKGTALPNGITATSQTAADNSTKVATTAYVDSVTKITRSIGYAFGDAVTGSALTTSEVGYLTVPFACTITGWHIMVDAGTATVKTWRVNGGTALPTVSNSISTSGVAISTGTKVDSTTVTDFTSTALAVNDTLGFSLSAVATAKQLTFSIDCQHAGVNSMRRWLAGTFLFLCYAIAVFATITHVNTTGAGAASCGSSFNSCANFSWGTTTSAGDFVAVGWQGQYTDNTIDISSITDNGGTHATWNCPAATKASVTVSAGVSVGNTKLCYAYNTPAGISNITVTFNKTAIDGGLDVTHWRGVATGADPTDSAVEGESSNLTCSTTNCAGKSVTPSTATELLIQNTYVQNQVQSVSSSGGTWTLDGTPNGNGLAFRITTTAATTQPTFVVNTTGKYCWSAIGFWMTAPVLVGQGHAIIF